MIQVENLTKLYGELVAVDDLSFGVAPGEVLGLVGPNGAGKTTTLRSLVGIIRPTRGTVKIGGHDLERDPVAAKRLLAFMPTATLQLLSNYKEAFSAHRTAPALQCIQWDK